MSRTSARRGRGVLLGASLTLLFAPGAHASEVFPSAIREAWGISDLGVPGQGCLLCHMTDPGVFGNVQQPFGLTVKQYDVPVRNPAALKAALGKMRAAGTDSDGDGREDYEELLAGTNVNIVNEVETSEPEPEPGSDSSGASSAGGGEPSENSGGRPTSAPEPARLGSASAPLVPETGCSVSSTPGKHRAAWLLGLFALFGLQRRAARPYRPLTERRALA